MTTAEPLLEVRDLRVVINSSRAPVTVVDGVSFDVHTGATIGLVGESGSGKTLSALSIAGLLPAAASVAGGSVRLAGRELLSLPRRERRAALADQIGVVFQNPGTALNPRLTIGAQVREALPKAVRRDRKKARHRVIELLDLAGIPAAQTRLPYYPHELSGGLNQRVVISLAIAREPALLIADEPTTALDVSIQAQVLDLIDRLRAELRLGVLLVSHDIGIIADRTNHFAVMRGGAVLEHGPTKDVLRRPQHAYTRRLLSSVPAPAADEAAQDREAEVPVLVRAERVVREFPAPGGSRRVVRALDGVSIAVTQGQALGIVGESGSGKTTLARMLVGLDHPTSGQVSYEGSELSTLRGASRRRWRRDVQYIFQDPYSALDPRLTVEKSLAEPIELSGTPEERAGVDERIAALFDEVELPSALRRRLPGQLSGGQRQRVVIARALALSPRLVIADEPVSALDLPVQATIVELLRNLRERRALSYVVISHDLSVIQALCGDVAVIHDGQVVESGPTTQVLRDPQHPHTTELIQSVPGRALDHLIDPLERTAL
ncbi:MAG TPA: ABC transporter ATP-binding protein [Streptosporangiaceae bacterium]|jgi:peptide/nickel transport system ATP-binding protein